MAKAQFDLYLDESGNFIDGTIDPQRPNETSLVGGLLIASDQMTNELAMELLPNQVHCCQKYKKYYLDVLERIIGLGGRFVIFENKERIRVVNSDKTYLNIISEGLIKLLRDLANDHPQGINVKIIIATRKAINESSGIISEEKYREELEEKIIMALGRNNINGCEYRLTFEDARYYKLLDFADIICNTWLTRRRKVKFSSLEQLRIEKAYSGQLIYTVFEDAMTTYLKQLMLERHYGEAIYQLCTLKKLAGFTPVRNQLVQLFLQSDRYEQETWLAQMSLLIGQYNRLRMYEDGISLAENYIRYFLEVLQSQEKPLPFIAFWRFDTDFFLLTMYDHIGNAAKCQQHLLACRDNITCVNRSWEHIDYYFSFCIRELNVLMGRFAFKEVINRSNHLIHIFTEARDLFSMIKTYNDTKQLIRSELLGKVYGVRLEAMINLLHKQTDLFDEALDLSNKAIVEFDDPRDISRQLQWRCLLMVEAGKPQEAFEALLQAVNLPVSDDAPKLFLETVYQMRAGTYDFLLWHYTNVMLEMKKADDPHGLAMEKALLTHPRFLEDLRNNAKKGHPWNLVLWNIARYVRTTGNLAAYKKCIVREWR